MAEVM